MLGIIWRFAHKIIHVYVTLVTVCIGSYNVLFSTIYNTTSDRGEISRCERADSNAFRKASNPSPIGLAWIISDQERSVMVIGGYGRPSQREGLWTIHEKQGAWTCWFEVGEGEEGAFIHFPKPNQWEDRGAYSTTLYPYSVLLLVIHDIPPYIHTTPQSSPYNPYCQLGLPSRSCS